MSRAALQYALSQSLFMTGHIPDDIVPQARAGELRSYLPPDQRPTLLALSLYVVGVTPWSWARDPDWLEYHDVQASIDVAATKAWHAAHRIAAGSIGLQAAVLEAEQWLNEQGRYLADPETGERLFKVYDEEVPAGAGDALVDAPTPPGMTLIQGPYRDEETLH